MGNGKWELIPICIDPICIISIGNSLKRFRIHSAAFPET